MPDMFSSKHPGGCTFRTLVSWKKKSDSWIMGDAIVRVLPRKGFWLDVSVKMAIAHSIIMTGTERSLKSNQLQ